MRALVYTATGQVEMQYRPEPVAGPDDVTIDVNLVGICGSDVLGYLGRSPGRRPPLVLGHEFTGWWDGRPVVVNPIVSCGRCARCLEHRESLCTSMRLAGLHHDGAMQERVKMPARNVIVLDDEDDHDLMVMAEPFACSIHATTLVPDPGAVRSLIIGFGSLGCMTALALRHQGSGPIDVVDTSPARTALAGRFRVRAISAADIKPSSYDCVYDCAGYSATRALSAKALVPGGHLVLIGYGESDGGIDFVDVVRREIHLHGAMAYGSAEFNKAVRLLREGILDARDLIKVYPLDRGQEAFDEARTSKSSFIKTALRAAESRR